MADQADYEGAAPKLDKDPVPTGGDVATRTPSNSLSISKQAREQLDQEHRPDHFVEQVEDKAREAGDPYFGEYAEDPDDIRANEGIRPAIDIDAPKED